jgi:hypothetical protein
MPRSGSALAPARDGGEQAFEPPNYLQQASLDLDDGLTLVAQHQRRQLPIGSAVGKVKALLDDQLVSNFTAWWRGRRGTTAASGKLAVATSD